MSTSSGSGRGFRWLHSFPFLNVSTVITREESVPSSETTCLSTSASDMAWDEENSSDTSVNTLRRANPFLTNSQTLQENGDAQPISKVSASPLLTRISDNCGEIAKLYLSKTEASPGNIIHGTFDFKESAVFCSQYCVSLVSVDPPALRLPHLGKTSFRTVHCSTAEICLGLANTYFEIQLPDKLPAKKKGQSKWMLRFEFVISSTKEFGKWNKSGTTWKAPAKIDIRTQKWELPLKILDR